MAELKKFEDLLEEKRKEIEEGHQGQDGKLVDDQPGDKKATDK